jgi:hypothetical protein
LVLRALIDALDEAAEEDDLKRTGQRLSYDFGHIDHHWYHWRRSAGYHSASNTAWSSVVTTLAATSAATPSMVWRASKAASKPRPGPGRYLAVVERLVRRVNEGPDRTQAAPVN